MRYVACTGIYVLKENSVSRTRDAALNEVVDPFAKKILKKISESELSKLNQYDSDTLEEMR